MNGNSSHNQPGIYTGANARPPSLDDSGYWQINDTFLYLFGGISETYVLQNALWRYDIVAQSWSWINGYSVQLMSVNASVPYYRSGVGFASDNSNFAFIFGGQVAFPGFTGKQCFRPSHHPHISIQEMIYGFMTAH
jgi:hypothetical protein